MHSLVHEWVIQKLLFAHFDLMLCQKKIPGIITFFNYLFLFIT